jgi:predicted GNAT family acetyltransferase
MFDQHIEDVTKVGIINFAAFAVSMTDVSEWLRLLGLAAALVYTCLKIVQTIQDICKK